MVDICEIARILLNTAFIGTIIFAYTSVLTSIADVQKYWKPQWNDFIEKPEFISYGVEGYKLRDIKALSFFYMEKYKNIPDSRCHKICMKVKNKLIVFPSILFLLAISLSIMPC